MSKSFLLFFIANFILFLSPIATHPDDETPLSRNSRISRFGKDWFVLGCNLPWLDGKMGWDIAFKEDWGYGFDQAHVEKYFADMRRMGFRAVRWWLFADCRAGLSFDDKGRVLGVQDEVFYHLDIIMDEICPKYQMYMYWCLLSSLSRTDYLSIITDDAIRKSYIENALIPLASRYKDNPYFLAVDITNEPEADLKGRWGNWTSKGTDEKTLRAFLADCAKAIHQAAPKVLVSVGSGWHTFENLQRGLYKDLGLDFYDFHIYNDTGFLPEYASLKLDAPCIIGEFNCKKKTAADEEAQKKIFQTFLSNAWNKGYAGVFIWCYDYPREGVTHSLLRTDGNWKACVSVIKEFSEKHQKELLGY